LQGRVREAVERLVREYKPSVVGLSVMTFQRKTARKVIELIRSLDPTVLVAVGGYDPSLAPEGYTEMSGGGADFIVRGEGEITFRELLRTIENGSAFDRIAGLSFRTDDGFRHNKNREVSSLDGGEIWAPNRNARVLSG